MVSIVTETLKHAGRAASSTPWYFWAINKIAFLADKNAEELMTKKGAWT